jgi:hypothetical protein
MMNAQSSGSDRAAVLIHGPKTVIPAHAGTHAEYPNSETVYGSSARRESSGSAGNDSVTEGAGEIEGPSSI